MRTAVTGTKTEHHRLGERTVFRMEHTARQFARTVLPLGILCAASLFCMSGCGVIAGKYVAEDPFKEDGLRKVQYGETTKQDVLDWFGPPLAIVREGTVLMIPLPGSGEKVQHEVRAESVFAYFAPKREITKDHIIYYYQGTYFNWAEIFLLEASFPTSPVMHEKRLWILINEKTGKVEDHLQEEAIRETKRRRTGYFEDFGAEEKNK